MKGYASVFNTPTEILDVDGRSFTEVVRPGAFARSLKEFPDVIATVNHDFKSIPLGRTSAGTLSVGEDAHGLWMDLDLPPSAIGDAVRVALQRGDLNGASFTFDVLEDVWSNPNGKPHRELVAVRLYEVSVVTFGAYSEAGVSLRNLKFANWHTQSLRLRLELLEKFGVR